MSSLEQVLDGRTEHVGGFSVHRVLPFRKRRSVGPFVFFDHMGPAELAPGHGADVRPHPHIGLATVTYLFEGEIIHRDSVRSLQSIHPGDVNWMTAGRGVAHSERSPDAVREHGGRMHGIQSWVALPVAHEEDAPSFAHHPASTLPVLSRPGAELRLIAGHAYGERSPVAVLSPTFYVHAELEPGATIDLPDDHAERAAYVVRGEIEHEGTPYRGGQMLIFTPGTAAAVRATGGPACVMLLGGAPLDAPRFMWWNFVSSSHDRIEQAKRDWADGRFDPVHGDPDARLPLPE